jgi:hypothetical protein
MGRTHAKDVSEQGAVGNIWTQVEVARDLRRLHNEELHILYAAPNIIRMIK